jgi:cytochrome c-type biogenesis protein CcmE
MARKNNNKVYLAALALFIAGTLYLAVSGFSGGTLYFIDVAEALVLPEDKPQAVRLFGRVREEGISRLQDRVGVRFQLEDKNLADKALWVTYTGALPDAFAPGAEVIVEGLYRGDQESMEARKLMTQCPSKYKKKES